MEDVHKSDLKGEFSRFGWNLEELHTNLGARISGIDGKPSSLSSEQCMLLQAALASYDLLLFPDQVLSPAEEFAFITTFPHDKSAVARAQNSLRDKSASGPVLRIPDFPLITVWPQGIKLDDYWGLTTPEVVWEDHYAAWRQDWGDRLNSNSSTALYHVESNEGNQVCFASASAAWDRLTPDEKSAAAKLRAVYRRDAFAGCGVYDTCEHNILRMPLEGVERVRAAADARGTTGTVIPLFNEDPLTGSRAINTHPLHFYTFEGMQRREAGELLKSFILPVISPDQVVNVTWKRGDLAVWNNRKVLHTGTPSRAADRAATRLFHMTLLDCDAPLRPITV
ncbi:probable (R)-phenoxypropionate/alpha-ketoglutarate-dioxygenase [Coccomyxa sp. Obi]|nr:probable (R)-phenoxypropionate/alpha-ketoglutarate-dioxygenase [Coccomyxa sp. Obi]